MTKRFGSATTSEQWAYVSTFPDGTERLMHCPSEASARVAVGQGGFSPGVTRRLAKRIVTTSEWDFVDD